MKVENVSKERVAFEPIELKVTIESMDELKLLLARLNSSPDQVLESGLGRAGYLNDVSSNLLSCTTRPLWKFLDNIYKERTIV